MQLHRTDTFIAPPRSLTLSVWVGEHLFYKDIPFRRLFHFISAFVLLAGFALSAFAHEEEPRCSYRLGVVPQFEQRTLAATWAPILYALEVETGCDIELVGTQTIGEFEAEFMSGIYDIAYMNPYHAVMAEDAQGYVPVVRAGKEPLRGVLAVHANSDITDVKQLRGKEVAFPSPNALGASLLMRAELKRLYGVEVKPLYVETHSSVYLHVAKGLAYAGGGVLGTLNEQRSELRSKLRVIYTTQPLPAHPLVVHPRLGEQGIKKIQEAWLRMADRAPSLVANIPMPDPVKTTMQDYAGLRGMELHRFMGDGN